MTQRILFITPLPPPVHGSAMVSQYIKDSALVNEQYDCDFVNLSTSRRMDEIGKGGAKKILRFVGSYIKLFWKLLTHRYDLCYLAITCHGMGFLKDAPFVLLCKLFRRKVLIHQHNKGMSGCVDRWPYRWLLPLVYRNTTVMLLSWHLYDDIAQVVSREQVVICANGIPSFFNENENEETAVLYENEDEDENENSKHSILNTTQTKSPTTDCADYTEGSQLTVSTQVNSHTDFNENDNENENCLRNVALNLTQTSQNSRNYISEQDNQRELDTIAQNLQVASPLLASGAQDHPDGEDAAELQAVACCPLSVDSIEKGDVKLLFLSNLIESKGIFVLLDACRVLKERGLDFTCDFVGGESKAVSAEAFREAIAERGLADRVVYHGPKYGEDKVRFFTEADIFVQPTFDDCFPLTLVEAMQYRLPIVSTDVGAIPDMIVEEVNGLMCQQRDVDSLVVALERLIKDSALRTRMGEQGYARYRELYTLEAFEKRFVGIIARCAVNSSGAVIND